MARNGAPLHRVQERASEGAKKDDRSAAEKRADELMDRQIDLPLYALLGILVAHALSGTSSFSLPHLSTHLPYSIQTLLPSWARNLPLLAPFSTELPNASHDSKHFAGEPYWSTATTGYAGPFRSDAVGFGHPLTALHNLTRACLGLSYEVRDKYRGFLRGSSALGDDMHYSQGYYDRYPWNSWLSQADQGPSFWARKYGKGAKDIFFVLTGVLLFTILRALAVRFILNPLANFAVPAVPSSTPRSRKGKLSRLRRRTCGRFAEQAWVALWGTFSLSFSLFVASQEPYWNDESALWSNWPFTQLSGLTKFYYLFQTSFWVQQVIVLNVEDRRNDHWQMLSHHFVTIALLLGSYMSHFTPIGNVVLILMDPCDILLSTAKCLRYAGKQVLCDVCFGMFMLGWIVSRHVLYLRALYSCIAKARYILPELPGATFNDYWGFRTCMGFTLVVLLCILQVILCVWLVMIVRVAWRVVSGQGAADERSDAESEDEEGHPVEIKAKQNSEPSVAEASAQATCTASNHKLAKRKKK